MITVELLNANGDVLCMASWPAVPSAGELFFWDGKEYRVGDRDWGTCCHGDGSPIPDKLSVSLTLVEP
jgi:hypothetical protein